DCSGSQAVRLDKRISGRDSHRDLPNTGARLTRAAAASLQCANQTTDEDKFVSDNFALLKSAGWLKLASRSNWAEVAPTSMIWRNLTDVELSLWIDCARFLHAYSPSCHSCLAVDISKGRRRRAAPKTDRQGTHPAADKRRLGLDRRLWQSRKGGWRLSHRRT